MMRAPDSDFTDGIGEDRKIEIVFTDGIGEDRKIEIVWTAPFDFSSSGAVTIRMNWSEAHEALELLRRLLASEQPQVEK